jgi:putative FmdB family regulatory protein
MPLYEYYCADCQTKFERLIDFAAADRDLHCAHCEGTRVRRLLSVFAARRGGDGEFGDGYDFEGSAHAGASCGCGGACSCGH